MKPSRSPSRKPLLLRGVVLTLLTAVVYIPAMQATGFTWDDDDLLDKPIFQPGAMHRVWLTTETTNYWPITNTSFWIQNQLWGLNPTGYHVVNVMQHVICALLLWRVLVQLAIPAAWLVALLFAVHPVNVETAGWIAQQKSLLSILFYLASLSAWLEFEDRSQRRWYGASLALYLISMLAKTASATMPVVLLLCAWWRRGRVGWTDVRRVLPFLVVAVVLSLVEIWFQSVRAIGDTEVRTDSLLARLAGAGWVTWFYLYKAYVPLNLSFVYPRWEIDPTRLISWLPDLALVLVLALAFRARHGWGRPVLFALLYFVVTLAPVLGFLNIFFMRYSFVADHYQYIAIAAPLALAVGVTARHLRTRPGIGYALGTSLVLGLALLSWRQSHIYQSAETLWRDTLAKNPNASIAYHNLALELREQGKLDEANQLLRTATILEPEFVETYISLGRTLELQGRHEEAVRQYERALEISPKNLQAHYNLGNALRSLGRLAEAEAQYRQALSIDARDAASQLNLAVTLCAQKRFEESLPHYAEALRLKPGYPLAHQNLGLALSALDRPQQAFEHLQQAVEREPNNPTSHYYLALVLAKAGNTQPAVTHLREAVRLAPEFSAARQALAELTGPPPP